MFEISKENYKKEIDIINSAHSSEMAQKEEIINIRVKDKSGPPLSVSPASFSVKNLSFEFGT